MKKIFTINILVLLASTKVFAANFAVITSPPTILSFVVFLVGIGCLLGALKVLALVKGGLLSKSWQMFLFGFIALIISQAANLMSDFEIYPIPTFVVPALLTIAVGLFLYGVFETKKTLE